MTTYNSKLFKPPAPMAQVILRNPDAGMAWTDVPMLIDPGADVTMVPEAVLTRLNTIIVPNIEYELIGFNGAKSRYPMVQIDLVFCRRTFHGQYLLINEAYGIIGRNVLNSVPIFLDGPNLTWGEYRNKP